MSSFKFPSERSGSYNPKYYEDSGASGDVTQAELDTKANRSNDTLINPTLANASFTGATSFAGATVTGLPVSTITNNNIVNTSVTTDFMDRTYDKQDQAIQTMPDDVIAYYDFSNSSAVGYDFSGRGHHLTNPFAVESSSDVTRTYVAKLTDRRTTASVSSVSATNGTVLVSDNTDIATALKSTPSFSVSFWIKPETSSEAINGTIWDCADVSSVLHSSYPTRPKHRLRMGYNMSSQQIFLQIYDQTVGTSYICTPIVARNTWTHVTFTRSFTTNTNIWYLNGVAVAGTSPGYNPDHRNLALTKFSVGAAICPEVSVVQNIATPSYTEFFRGSISDLLFTARDISAEEVLKIRNDNYGSSVIVIAGQSNAVGYCDLVSGIDDVYTGLQGRVFQYNTTTNTPDPGTVVATTVSAATNPLNMPVVRTGSTGFWKSFCEDMLKYSNLPFRRKILLVPCANPGQNIAFFKSGAQGGETIKNATNSALNLSTLNRLTAFLWHQGENDIQEQNLNYKADFLAVIANFQSTITGFTSTLPKITGEVSALYYDTFLSADGLTHMKTFHRQKMQEICTADASYRYVRTNDLTYYDGSHFDAPAQRVIGSRYFDAMIDVLGQPSLRLETSAVRKRVKVLESAVTALQSALLTNETLSDFDVQTVKYYGAVGDGIADDTAAIQAAINANAKRVFFPQGTYRITGELLIQNKPEFELSSESAILLQDHTTSTLFCLRIINCDGFLMEGRLILKSNIALATPVFTTEVVSGYGNGLYIDQSSECILSNLQVLGPFLTGISLGLSDILILNALSDVVVKRCVTGIAMAGEYYTVENAIVEYCRTGIFITAGNNSVVSSSVNLCRIGIYVLGGTTVNTDHGKIIGCTVNHNCAAGILIKNTQFSFHITGCEVWANVGNTAFYQGYLPVSLDTDITKVSARSTFFGVYLENVESINMTGNVISRNCVNVGLDGWVVSTISTNTFGSDPGRTTSHITEYGSGHDAFARNAQNVVTSNTFYGAYKAGSPNIRMKFLDAPATTNDDCCVAFSDNRGTTGIHYLQVNSGTTGAQLYDMNYEYMNLHAASPADVKLHPSTGGSAITINVSGIGGAVTSKTVGVQTTTPEFVPMSMTPSCTYNDTTKQYTFTANGSYRFFPTGIFMNNWTIYGPEDGSTVTGFLGFDNIGATALTHWGTGRFGSICSNLTGGHGELAFCNHNATNPTSSGPSKSFAWYKYTSATTKTVQASMTYDGAFDVPGTITGPTITGLQAADTALQGRALLLEDGVSLLGARVGILEAGSGAPTFQKLTQGSTTVETNASLKNVYFLTMSANSNTTLTFPDLVPGDSKYSGFSIKVRVRSGSATETLTLTCPASPSAFVPMAAGRYNSKVFNALDSYVEYVTAEGDYVELVSTAVN